MTAKTLLNQKSIIIMTSVKPKFRESTVEGNPGSIFFQIIHNRVVRQLGTDYKIYSDEWDEKKGCIIVKGERKNLLAYMNERLGWDIERLKKVVRMLETDGIRYTVEDVIEEYHKLSQESSFFSFMHTVIAQLKQLGRERTSETYASALKSFKTFRNGQDLPVDGIGTSIIQQYEAWLKNREVCLNSISFYMRILRAVYNRAVEQELTPQRHPFKHVYTGIEKTVKRAVPIKVVKALKHMDLTLKPKQDFARDMFLFSFYTRGMSFIDMAYLKTKNLQYGVLTYRRRKTGQQLTIKWEKDMEAIRRKYARKGNDYLLPIITKEDDTRRQYVYKLRFVNKRLKELSKLMGLTRPLTMYVARHSWASAAKTKNVPISVISEGMGHDSELTTQIYLASLETSVVDKANRMILSLL